MWTKYLVFLLASVATGYKTIPQIITDRGYPKETHYVTTPDGYILTTYRIPHGKNARSESKDAILLHHGIFCTPADFLIQDGDHALGFVLADAGYDVWFGTARGMTFSRNHTTLNPDTDQQFWNFSLHEIGTIDLPVTVDYILKVTQQDKLFYVGFSQGSTIYYILCSSLPDYNKKFKASFSLAPTAFLSQMRSIPTLIAVRYSPLLNSVLKALGVNEIAGHSDFLASTAKALCSDRSRTQEFCFLLVLITLGYSQQFNRSLMEVDVDYYPSGASRKQVMQYAQFITSGHFRQYDFGRKNKDVYGTTTPPDYNVSLITSPTYLFSGRTDIVAVPEDVDKLCQKIGRACVRFLIGNKTCNHADYLYGKQAPELVFSKVLSLLRKH